jgi:hypothetical protein
MQRLICLLLLTAAVLVQTAGAQTPSRGTVKREVLDLTKCVAQPGDVPIPLGPGAGVEIVDWTTASTPTNHTGEFVLWFAAPLATATLFTYDAGAVFYSISNVWNPLPAGRDDKRRLQVRPFPAGLPVEAVKITVPAQRDPAAKDTAYRATLPFATVVPVSVVDIAKDATVGAGYDGVSREVKELTDGTVGADRNFTVSKPTPINSPIVSPWILLSWDQTQSVRGLALFSGKEERGLADSVIEGCVSATAPREAKDKRAWQPASVRVSDPGGFRSNQFAVVMHEFLTRGVRIRNTNGMGEISLGEILVFSQAPQTSPGKTNTAPTEPKPAHP